LGKSVAILPTSRDRGKGGERRIGVATRVGVRVERGAEWSEVRDKGEYTSTSSVSKVEKVAHMYIPQVE